jgi:hypothetical protein
VIVGHYPFHHLAVHIVRADIVPGICWFETLAGRWYLARDLTRDNRAEVLSRLDTPRTNWHYPMDKPVSPGGKIDVCL